MMRVLLMFAVLGAGPAAAGAGGKEHWIVEQMPGGTVEVRDGTIEIRDAEGGTVWWREKLRAPLVIRYELTMVSAGGPHDRVSDANCFFLATDPKAPEGCPFAPGFGRSGRFADYDSLRTYYVGMGGNTNTTTRFRRYDGHGAKPLLPGHDLQEQEFLLEANRPYQIEIRVSADGLVEYLRDGKVFFAWRDPQPLQEGWFALRTVKSHQIIRGLKISR